jgi:hypothetical protein
MWLLKLKKRRRALWRRHLPLQRRQCASRSPQRPLLSQWKVAVRLRQLLPQHHLLNPPTASRRLLRLLPPNLPPRSGSSLLSVRL